MKQTIKYIYITLIISILSAASAFAINNTYLMEIGGQVGANYYVGDANPHIFMQPRELIGGQLRYKFDRRWSLAGKAQWTRYSSKEFSGTSIKAGVKCITADITAEFNFFEYGNDWEMGRIKPYTPYIFLGVGLGCYGRYHDDKIGFPLSAYFPFGIGFKWKFAPRWGLNVAWQHNLYFKDNLERVEKFNNTHDLNGSNILENDMTGHLTLGIVFDFFKAKRRCITCDW